MEKAKLKIKCIEAGHEYVCEMGVQYNPSSLRYRALAGNVPLKGAASGENNKVYEQAVPPSELIMTVELIFDKVLAEEAFLHAQSAPSIAGLASGIVSNRDKLMKTETYTVRPVMNALMYLLLDPATRQVEFVWGNMNFEGQLVSVNSQYTMFDPSGEPVRGKVILELSESSTNFDNKWKSITRELKKYSKAKGSDIAGDGNTKLTTDKTLVQKAASLININL